MFENESMQPTMLQSRSMKWGQNVTEKKEELIKYQEAPLKI